MGGWDSGAGDLSCNLRNCKSLDCISRQNPALCDIGVASVEVITYSGFKEVGAVIQLYSFNSTFWEWIKDFLSDGTGM